MRGLVLGAADRKVNARNLAARPTVEFLRAGGVRGQNPGYTMCPLSTFRFPQPLFPGHHTMDLTRLVEIPKMVWIQKVKMKVAGVYSPNSV
jgi:hypothetical protein